MKCDEAKGLLPEYLTGELSDDQDQAIRDHIGRCNSCGAEFARMRSVARLISMGSTVSPPDSYFSRFPGKVMKRINISTSPQRRPRHYRYLRQAIFVSGVAALALVLLFIWPNDHFDTPGPIARRPIPTEFLVINGPSDEELLSLLGSLDLSETGATVDLLYNADPWEALPDMSDEELEIVLTEILQET
ncbi:MAG: zf-HC2 domain-containing protein [Deltaproteobacteria bacterium]|nr:zf-HC2 domain-containing protein [Candidatus Zymogenaceae bacterium]